MAGIAVSVIHMPFGGRKSETDKNEYKPFQKNQYLKKKHIAKNISIFKNFQIIKKVSYF